MKKKRVLLGELSEGFAALADRRGGKQTLRTHTVKVKGWGRLLIEHAKRTAVDLGAEQLLIQGDPNAGAFYLAAGGVLTGSSESASIPGRFLPIFAIELRPSHA